MNNTKRAEVDVQIGGASQRLCNRAVTEFVKPRNRAACSMPFACACEWPQAGSAGSRTFSKAVFYRQGELRGELVDMQMQSKLCLTQIYGTQLYIKRLGMPDGRILPCHTFEWNQFSG